MSGLPQVFPNLFVGHCDLAGVVRSFTARFRDYPLVLPDWLLSRTEFSQSAREKYGDEGLQVSVWSLDARMFQIHFVLETRKPHRVDKQWNCSKSVWPGLYRLLPVCDKIAQCVDEEDETDCDYYSPECRAGRVKVGESCFFSMQHRYSFHHSEAVCRRFDGSAGSFDSTAEWQSVKRLLGITSAVNKYWIGLRAYQDILSTKTDIYIKNMYAYTWLWNDGHVAYNFHSSFGHVCSRGVMHGEESRATEVTAETCLGGESTFWARTDGMVCETRLKPRRKSVGIDINVKINISATPAPLVTCRLGHLTHLMLACDPHSRCTKKVERRGLSRTASCTASAEHTVPYFRCAIGDDNIPYSLVCDWTRDCGDNSDESFCQFPACGKHTFQCGHGQCISQEHDCDYVTHCKTHFDEKQCQTRGQFVWKVTFNVSAPPAIVHFDREGSFSLIKLPTTASGCPDTHYQCPGDGYCLPIYTKCNGVNDCPGQEDEALCDVYTCYGLYRCRGNRIICMHVQHLCDGWPQCPDQDDELFCMLTESCPDRCVCYGKKLSDLVVSQADTFPKIRYLEGRGSGLTLDVIRNETMLIYLGAGDCGWTNFSKIDLPNLHVLDISDNPLEFINIDYISHLLNLKEFILSGTPLSFGFFGLNKRRSFESLLLLNLSGVSNHFSQLHALSFWLPKLEVIDFSHSQLKSLEGLEQFTNLKILNLRGCLVSDYRHDFMKDMNYLQQAFVEDFKLCCPAVLPSDFIGKCCAPTNEISSCDNLLKSGLYRAALAIFATAALSGNLCSFVYRLWFTSKRKLGYAVFVLHLSMSDFFMGVYLMVIGLADHLFAGNYMWKESFWKRSTICKISGFISFLSSEVSSVLICLISLDRFLVIRFPFSRLHFRSTSAHVACTVSWGLGVILASIPLLPVTSHWAFYSQTGICIPLPVTRADFPGRHYSFGVMIVFNLVLFIIIAAGQALIFWTIRVNTMSNDGLKTKDNTVTNDITRSRESTIARRLLIIALSDFVCWFPIGVCGILANLDVPIPGEINIAMAVIVLPFNSALNPFLYTYTIVREKLHKEKEAKLKRFITAHIKTPSATLNY